MLIPTAKKTRLSLPNKTSLGIYTGYGGVAGFTRTNPGTVVDFEGLIKTVPAYQPRFTGLRTVYNRITNPENISAAGGWTIGSFTVDTGIADPFNTTKATRLTALINNQQIYFSFTFAYSASTFFVNSFYVRRVSGTGIVKLKTPNGDAINPAIDITAQLTTNWKRFATPACVPYTSNSVYVGVLVETAGDVIEIAFPQPEEVSGQANQNPSEYNLKFNYYPYLNGNTVVNNVVTDGIGEVISETTINGLLIEPTSTNYATYSNDFRNTTDAGETRPWGYTGVSAVQHNSLIIKNVSFNKIIEDSTVGNSHSIGRIVSGLPYGAVTITCKLKAGTRGYAILASIANANGTSKTYNVVVDLSTGTAIGAGTLATANAPINANYQVKYLDDGVVEASITQDFVSGAGTQFNANLYIANTSTVALLLNPAYNGDGVSYIYATDFQVEVSAFKTSHIQTTTASVTRNTDLQTIQTAQNINRYQGSLSFEFTPTHNAVGTVALGGSKQDDNNYTQILHIAGTGYIFRKCISGINYDATLAGDFVADTTYTVKIKWSSYSGTEIFVNGVKGVNNPNTAPLPLGSVWYVGADRNGANQAGACFKNVLTKHK